MPSDHLSIPSELGSIRIASSAVADVVARTAARSYGVVGLASRTRTGRLLGRERAARLLGRERAASAVSIAEEDGKLRIDLHVVVEYGLTLAEIATTLRSQVTYEVERLTGFDVAAVDVHIDDTRKSK